MTVKPMQEGTLGNLVGGHLRPRVEEVREPRVRPGHSGGERTGHRGCDIWSNLKRLLWGLWTGNRHDKGHFDLPPNYAPMVVV